MLVAVSTCSSADEQLPRQEREMAGIIAVSGVTVTAWATDLSGPRGLLVDASGGIWVAEQSTGRVVKVGLNGQIRTIADGLRSPHDLEMDTHGNVYVAETPTGSIRMISPTGVVSTYADGLDGPVDLAFNRNGELLVCEYGGQRVVAFSSPREKQVVVSGFRPHGLAFQKSGAVYVNDISGSRLIRHRSGLGSRKPVSRRSNSSRPPWRTRGGPSVSSNCCAKGTGSWRSMPGS